MRKAMLYLSLFFTFLLGIHDGFIALYNPPDREPVDIFPYTVASLPLPDQERLKKGIPIPSPEALQQYLQDYLS